jgi:hypothetical protein
VRRPIAVGVIVLALAAAFTASAGATGGVVVSTVGCAFEGGSTTVPSGASITIEGIGEAEGSRGLIKTFLLKEHTTLTISDATNTAYDLSNEWAPPEELAAGLWVTRLPNTDLGISLAAGQSILATYDVTFAQPLLVAFPPVGPSGENGPFLTREDGPLSCLITGT